MLRAIELDNLLTYSNIYGLGLTDLDCSHLKAMYNMYNGKCAGSYIYKATARNCDLVLNFTEYAQTGPIYVNVHPVNKMASQHGYPLFCLEGLHYFKLPPKLTDLPNIVSIVKTLERPTQELLYPTVADFKSRAVQKEFGPFRYASSVSENFVEACFWAADKEKDLNREAVKLFGKKGEYSEIPTYVNHIVAVLQLPNDARLAFFIGKKIFSSYGTNQSYDLHLGVYVTRPGDDCYNFTDPDKYFSHLDEQTKRPRVIYPDPTNTFPKDKDVIAAYRRGRAFMTIDSTTLGLLNTRWTRKQQEIANEQAAVVKLEKKIADKIKELDKGGTFSYNDMTFDANGFEYEGQRIADANVKMVDILNRFAGNYSEERLNFEQVLKIWLERMYYNLLTKQKTTGKIGDVDYDIVMSVTKSRPDANGKSVESKSFRINGCRINKDEVQAVLERAICFPTTEDFNEFCRSVAACSLRYHKMISSGLVVGKEGGVHDEIFDEWVHFKMDLERVKNRNYLVVGNKKWKVSDTNRLLTLENATDMTRVISVLLAPGVVGMTGEEIKDVLEGGKKALIEQKQREEELLKQTVDQFKIEKLDGATCGNGKILSGYLVHGQLRDYLVEESRCMVFEYPSGRYICMVDKGQNEHSNTARLVNRFYALSNDSKLAKEISTL